MYHVLILILVNILQTQEDQDQVRLDLFLSRRVSFLQDFCSNGTLSFALPPLISLVSSLSVHSITFFTPPSSLQSVQVDQIPLTLPFSAISLSPSPFQHTYIKPEHVCTCTFACFLSQTHSRRDAKKSNSYQCFHLTRCGLMCFISTKALDPS